MSKDGEEAEAARSRTTSSNGNNIGIPGNSSSGDAVSQAVGGAHNLHSPPHNLTTDLLHHNLSTHVQYIGAAPDVLNNTVKPSPAVMQPRAGYKSDGGGPKYFDPYDPWIGIRTAFILGGFLMLIVVYILYKARCRLGGSVEVNKVSYYQEYKERCRERILANIRARHNLVAAGAYDRVSPGGGGGENGGTAGAMDLTAEWIQSQPLCSAIPDEYGEVKTPNMNRTREEDRRIKFSDIQIQDLDSPDLRGPGGKERNKALMQLLRESNHDRFPVDRRNLTAMEEGSIDPALDQFSVCGDDEYGDYKTVPNPNFLYEPAVANSSDLSTYLNSADSPPLQRNTHFHKPLIHYRDSDQSIDENSNVPAAKLGTTPHRAAAGNAVHIEMVPLTSSPNRKKSNSGDDSAGCGLLQTGSTDSTNSGDSARSTKSAHSNPSPEETKRTSSRDTPLSRQRSQSHSSLIPSASSVSSGLEVADPLRVLNGGPAATLLHKKSLSNGNLVQHKLDVHLTLWKPGKLAVTKL